MRRFFTKWSVSLTAVVAAFFPFVVSATTVTDIYDQPSTAQISVASNHKFTMTIPEAFSDGETVQIVFPAGYVLTSVIEDDVDIADDGVDLTTAADCSGSEHASVGVSGQTITITVCIGDGGTIGVGSVVTIEIGTNASASGTGLNRITNPTAVASYFINLTGTSGNSGSVIAVTTTNGGSGVSATVPAPSGGSDTDPPDGGSGDGDGCTGDDCGGPPDEECVGDECTPP
ncbi:MAG: hypothetical protein AAB839_03410, partial [Patescibacteria group bacterium]